MTTPRALIRRRLEEAVQALRRRGINADVATMRLLRDFGLSCFDLGVDYAHHAPTIPVPAGDGPDRAIDDVTGRYSVQHPLHTAAESQVMDSVHPKDKDKTG